MYFTQTGTLSTSKGRVILYNPRVRNVIRARINKRFVSPGIDSKGNEKKDTRAYMQQFQLYIMEDGLLQVQQLEIAKNRFKMYKITCMSKLRSEQEYAEGNAARPV